VNKYREEKGRNMM